MSNLPALRSLPGITLIGAAALGALALGNAVATRRAERAHPPRGRFVTAHGVRLHLREAGAGPAILLVHGNVTSAEDFWTSGLALRLAQDHRVLAFDRPGFGHSARPRGRAFGAAAQARLLHAALTGVGVERALVLGHSWGTLVALSLALDHPETVEGLVLLSGYHMPKPRTDVVLPALNAVPGLGEILRHTTAPLVARLLLPRMKRKMFAPASPTARFRAEFADALAVRPLQLRASGADAASMLPDARALAPRHATLRPPLTILAGDADRIVEREHAEALHRAVAGSELRLLPGVGHMLHHVEPGAVAQAVRDTARRARAVLPAAA